MSKPKNLEGKTYSELILKYEGISNFAMQTATGDMLKILQDVWKDKFKFHEYKIYRASLDVQETKNK